MILTRLLSIGNRISGMVVKWHTVKDVPNSVLKHITLENDHNKPVTNSQGTQEVGAFLLNVSCFFGVAGITGAAGSSNAQNF